MGRIGRRIFLSGSALLAAGAFADFTKGEAANRPARSFGSAIGARVGLGSWITFNVGRDPQLLDECAAVMAAFFAAGGRLIDSSPMYGSSQGTIGYGLGASSPKGLFGADKVWTPLGAEAQEQIMESRSRWGIDRFQLLQVHNLVAWDEHLPMLLDMRANDEVEFVGITTSHGRRHDLMERIMAEQPIDSVQLTYNPVDREAEDRLLPLARERGIAVIANRPFRQGQLTRRLADVPLPGFAAHLQATSWAQLILKFILSHPASPVPIPATTLPAHASENVAAASGPMPDPATREAIARMIAEV